MSPADTADHILEFPEVSSVRDQSAFCVTVQQANRLAMDRAADKVSHLGKSSSPPGSEVVLNSVGGQASYEAAQAKAVFWELQIQSLSETYYYPLMVEDGAPFTDGEGQKLMSAFVRCLDFFEQVNKEQ